MLSVSYNKLWKRMIDLNIHKKELRTFLSPSTINKLNHDQFVSMEILAKLCEKLRCDVGDIAEFLSRKTGEEGQ